MRRVPLPASRAGRALLAFWAALLLAAVFTAGVLQWLGPLKPQHAATEPTAVPAMSAGLSASRAPQRPPQRPPVAAAQARPETLPEVRRHEIAQPDPALLESAPYEPAALLPRIAADGREARIVYAGTPPSAQWSGKARIAILLDGVGLSTADSLEAIDQLPPAVSLAVSPYASAPGPVLDAARKAGHELLLSMPMQPATSPADDEGGKELTDALGADENMQRAQWSLSRIQGYAGVTNAFAGQVGGGFAASPQFRDIIGMLSKRGLFFLDATPGDPAPAAVAGASADLRLDDPPDAGTIDRQLARLEGLAITNGSAIGIAGPVFPVTIRRLAEWSRTLPARGLVLVPVSTLVHFPGSSPSGQH